MEAGSSSALLVFDSHTHPTSYLPPAIAVAFRWINRRSMPAPAELSDVVNAGVNAVIANAVGDRLVTWWWGRRPWTTVAMQLQMIKEAARRAGAVMAKTAIEVQRAQASGQLAVVLGLEGADVVGRRIERLDLLEQLGVRLVAPVHLRTNQCGGTRLAWQKDR